MAQDRRCRMCRLVLRTLLLAAVLLWTGFIWSNSLETVGDSARRSRDLLSQVKPMMDWLVIPEGRQHHTLRKMAHITEFFIMGILMISFLSVFSAFQHHIWWRDILALVTCSLIAASDETIQLFVPGRSGQIRDFILDFLGALAGVILTHLLLYVLQRSRSGPVRTIVNKE